jgi:hypothetical protein
MNCPTSHESSFIDDKKPPSSTHLYRNPRENVSKLQPFSSPYDIHARSVDLTNHPNKLINSHYSGQNLNQHPLFNKPHVQPLLGRNHVNNIYSYNNSIDPFSYNPQIYKFYQSQQQQYPPNNYFRSEDPEKSVLIDQIYMYMRDQNGCRILQKKIEEKNPEFLSKFYEKVENNILNLMNDQFGNYVFQKFIEYCDKIYIPKILSQVNSQLTPDKKLILSSVDK